MKTIKQMKKFEEIKEVELPQEILDAAYAV